MRKRAEDQVVGFRDGARDRMFEYLPNFEVLKIQSGRLAIAPSSSIAQLGD